MQNVIHFLTWLLPRKYLSLHTQHQLSIVCRGLKIYCQLLHTIYNHRYTNKNYYIKNIVPQIMAANYTVQWNGERFYYPNQAYCRNNKTLVYVCKKHYLYIKYKDCTGYATIFDKTNFNKVGIYRELCFDDDDETYSYYKNVCHNHRMAGLKSCRMCAVDYYLQYRLHK